jgi:hypothetical protein
MVPGSDGKEQKEEKSRFDQLRDIGQTPEFSPLLGADYMLDALRSIGFVHNTGFGEGPFPWSELDAFARCSNRISEPWEYETLRDMSAHYIAGTRLGAKVFAKPPPWYEDDDL